MSSKLDQMVVDHNILATYGWTIALGTFLVLAYPIYRVIEAVLNRLVQFLFFHFLAKTKYYGSIHIHLPDEEKPRVFGDTTSGREVHLRVNNKNEFIWKCVAQADMGLAESFMNGDFDCEDITLLLTIFAANRAAMNGLDTPTAWLTHLLDRLSHLRRANTIAGSRKNIQGHYDLGNKMFQTFLDPTMTYSCAIFKSPSETLQDAQLNKLRHMIAKAQIEPHHHVLEIGSGWGSMAIEMVRMTGCRVTTLTLSDQQKELADERIKAAGFSERISVELVDYRKISGKFDRIVSIEMIEAVGHEYLPTYFETCWNLIKPGGRMVFQVITYPNKNYETYRKSCDFIQKYIFPGGICPSVNATLDAIETGSQFAVEQTENIGFHYARTLKEWRDNFNNNKPLLNRLGYDDTFIRRWQYYFSYCEAGFATEYLGTYQIVLTTPRYLSQ